MNKLKSAEEYLKEVDVIYTIKVLELLQKIQKDTIERVLELAAENAKLKAVEIEYTGVRAGGSYFVNKIDKNSILNLKQQLLEEIEDDKS